MGSGTTLIVTALHGGLEILKEKIQTGHRSPLDLEFLSLIGIDVHIRICIVKTAVTLLHQREGSIVDVFQLVQQNLTVFLPTGGRA